MALHLLCEVVESQPQHVDIKAFNAVLSGCARGAAWSVALGLLRRAGDFVPGGVTEVTYNVALGAAGRANRWEETMNLLEEMRGLMLRCDFISFNNSSASVARFPSPAVAESLKMGVYGKVSATGLRILFESYQRAGCTGAVFVLVPLLKSCAGKLLRANTVDTTAREEAHPVVGALEILWGLESSWSTGSDILSRRLLRPILPTFRALSAGRCHDALSHPSLDCFSLGGRVSRELCCSIHLSGSDFPLSSGFLSGEVSDLRPSTAGGAWGVLKLPTVSHIRPNVTMETAAPIMTVPSTTATPIMTTGGISAYTPATTTGVPIMTSSAAAAAPIMSGAPIMTTGAPMMTAGFGGYSGYTMPSGLDHSQGKWFAPGEALPPGFVVTTHPEGHTAPQSHHAMSDMARDSFVITTGTGAGEVKAASSLKKSKKSKKKKSSGCC
eukprot:symbB.v1.2.034762.t1/scaffold4498.1/size38904/3